MAMNKVHSQPAGSRSMNRNSSIPVWIAVALLCAHFLLPLAWGQDTTNILLVVAHPDDEYYFAATVYKLAVERNAHIDELVITDGEGGYRYSTLAAPYYRKSLTTESVGRKELPGIRRKEAINAGRVLGIRQHYFLNQKDERFTTDSQAGGKSGWNTNLIKHSITHAVRKDHDAFIFCILPRASTHGAHQAAAALTAAATRELPDSVRPVILGFDTDAMDFDPAPDGTPAWSKRYAFSFDRTTHLGFHDALNYQIIVDWMIAEHKSQGLLQTMCEKDATEYAWVDRVSAPQAEARAASLFATLESPVGNK
jgi:LmbE family N-acetylglucosaminyl deacetylase